MAGKRWRSVLVAMHVLTSVSWMAMALAQTTLVAHGVVTGGPARYAAYTMAEHLDVVLLQHLAVAAAYTGVMLSLLTPWGLLRFWWVTVKFVVTLAGIYLGIAYLGGWLEQAVHAAAAGDSGAGPAWRVMVGGWAVVAAIAFMAWVSTAKPWGRIRAAGRPVGTTPHPAWFAMAVAVPVLDTAAPLAGLSSAPLLSIISMLGYALHRRTSLARTRAETHGVTAASWPRRAQVPRRSELRS